MKIGELDNCNFRKQTLRTTAKLDESLEFVMSAVSAMRVVLTPEQEQRLRFVSYNALRWTADDVLAQAIEDGYEPKQ